MKTLVIWAQGSRRLARAKHRQGVEIIAWREDAALRAAGVPYRNAVDLLGVVALDEIDEAAMAWNKAWGRRRLVEGKSFRQLVQWRGIELWWFAELYLHHSTAIGRYVRSIESWRRILKLELPNEVEAVGLSREEDLLLARTCTTLGVLYHRRPRVPRLRLLLRTRWTALKCRWDSTKTWAASIKAWLGGEPFRPRDPRRRTVLFLSHAAFWHCRRDAATGEGCDYEHYFDRLIPAVQSDPALGSYVVAVGPRAAFRRRGWCARLGEWLRVRHGGGAYVPINRFTRATVRAELARATRAIRRQWKSLRGAPGLQASFTYESVGFGDLARPDFAATMLLQLPWAVRSMLEMRAVLDHVRPAALCLYAESSGWGRAALAACRETGTPTVALQHGIVYPKYYSYWHEADEGACPLPDRTAVFGQSAQRLLMALGRYPEDSLVLTGSPKYDDLAQAAGRWDRTALRARLGVSPTERLVVVASRFRGIRETHQSIGSAFMRLVLAVESLPGVICLVKPHPAEAARSYEECVREARAGRVRVLPPSSELTELLWCSDLLVTVESQSAIEALVLDRPVLILNMPTNLRALVDEGVALGVQAGDEPTEALKAILFDTATLERLRSTRQRYLTNLALGMDGQATRRILDLVRETALRSRAGA
jgi:hypothetical protein